MLCQCHALPLVCPLPAVIGLCDHAMVVAFRSAWPGPSRLSKEGPGSLMGCAATGAMGFRCAATQTGPV